MNKKNFRNYILTKRKALNNSFIDSASKKIFYNFLKFQNISQSHLVAGYYPINNEVNDLLILDYLNSQGFITLLPSITEGTKILSFKKYSENLINGKFDIKEPNTTETFLPDLILAPLVAFDKNGNRLGYGSGYYDSTLNYYNSIGHNVFYVGLSYGFQEVEKIDKSDLDVKLDATITEKKYKYFDRK